MEMTREEAIRIIKIVLAIAEDFEITVQGEKFTEEKCKEAVDMAIEALEQESKWIPVSERLPEAEYGESDSVLVCFENETQDVLYFDGGNWCHPTGETYISVSHKNGWHNKVVAWMPLPKPYEPQKRRLRNEK